MPQEIAVDALEDGARIPYSPFQVVVLDALKRPKSHIGFSSSLTDIRNRNEHDTHAPPAALPSTVVVVGQFGETGDFDALSSPLAASRIGLYTRLMDPIPSYETFMEPCLRALEGAGLVHKGQIIKAASDLVALTDEQRALMLDSGKATVARSRISWALAYLKQAGAIDNPRRGHYQMLQRGLDLLSSPERPINTKALEQFEDFIAFRQRGGSRSNRDAVSADTSMAELSPEEQLTAAAKVIRADVQSQILEQLKVVDPRRFEQIVLDVLRAIGYGREGVDAARVVGGTGDEGIDGVIDEDLLGLDSIYVQAKRWKSQVSRPDVQGFAGALQGQNATKGIMITTSSFSEPALVYGRSLANRKIVLIDGVRLAGLMYDHGVGVSDASVIRTRQLDTDYFSTDD